MRIFYASDSTPNPAFSSQIWRNNLLLPLRDLGHDVVEFEFDWGDTFRRLDPTVDDNAAFIMENRPRIEAALIEQIAEVHSRQAIDVFFSYFWDACATPATIHAIRDMGIQAVNWYCNGSFQLHLVEQLSPHYDFCLVPERFRLNDYRALGANPIYCQEAANPTIYYPTHEPHTIDVSFVGQAYGERPDVIAKIVEAGLKVRVWGMNWGNYSSEQETLHMKLGRWRRSLLRQSMPTRLPAEVVGGLLSDEEMIGVWNRTKINLGFSSCGNTHLSGQRIVQLRLRDFEVPMCGGFYLVEYMEELEEFFEVGREIECYRDFNEMIDKIVFYLKHDETREGIAVAGRKRSLRDHTWQKRFEIAGEQMGWTR